MPPSHPSRTPSKPSAANALRRALFSRNGRLGWALFLVAVALYVLRQALSPDPQGPTLGWDKLNHGTAFAVLAFAGLFALRERAHPVFWTTFGLLALGGGIELAQLYVPGRSAEWADMAADSIGIGVGLLLAMNVARRLDRRRQRRTAADSRPSQLSQPARQP